MSVVALRKESVDRNRACIMTTIICTVSLSARRAWIEITQQTYHRYENQVALRKESVDRNSSACQKNIGRLVALRKESVDRNPLMCFIRRMPLSRSPQGERG